MDNNENRAWQAGEWDWEDDRPSKQQMIEALPTVIEEAFELNCYEEQPASNDFVFSMMRLVLEAGSKFSWSPVFYAMRGILDNDEDTFLFELQEACLKLAAQEFEPLVDYYFKHWRDELEYFADPYRDRAHKPDRKKSN